ncbi:MAG: hypothetical protein HUU21_13835 [Polyangiaceae bacterium]|nr:hypothetical protein [Polyangiaceae bacterium]
MQARQDALSGPTEAAPPAPKDDRAPSPFALLFAPDRSMERQARIGKARYLLLFAWICSTLAGVALALRVDAASSTLRKLEMSGQLKSMSERQIAEDILSAERVFQVISIAKGITSAPLSLGLACLALLVLAWFFRGRIKGSAVAPVAAASLLPGAIANLLDAAITFRHAAIPPEGVPLMPRSLSAALTLVGRPLTEPWIKLGNALDFISLWAAIILGFGIVAAAQVPKRTAIIGTLIAWICYQLLAHVATGGAPRP